MNEIDRLKLKVKIERQKNKELKQQIRQMRRTVLSILDEAKEKVKDIMYTGDLPK